MKRFILSLSFLLSVFAISAHATYVFFNVPTDNKEGLDKLIYHMTIEEYPLAKGYYWADQANFVHGGHAIYIGLQPRQNVNEYRAIFSVFGKGARGISDHTSNGADGGAGSSGSITYPWIKGHRYTLEIALIKSDKTHSDEQAWQGSVTDETTHATTVIATYAVPLEWGHLARHSVFFAEYFIYNAAKYHGDHPAPRPEQPYAKVIAEAPTGFVNGTACAGTISGLKANQPNNEKLEKLSDTAATVETGLSAQKKAGISSSATSFPTPAAVPTPAPFPNHS